MSSENKFGAGDIVRLASGGPKMTVRNTIESGICQGFVQCSWFNSDGRLQHGDFPEGGLVAEEGIKAKELKFPKLFIATDSSITVLFTGEKTGTVVGATGSHINRLGESHGGWISCKDEVHWVPLAPGDRVVLTQR